MTEPDHTSIGGVQGAFNEDEPPPRQVAPMPSDDETEVEQPLEQHSPTKIHVPGWKEIVLGGSGGIVK